MSETLQSNVSTLRSCSLPRPAFLARTHIPQELPGVDTQLVAIVPFELERVFADGLCRDWFRGGLEHRQLARLRVRRLSRFASGFASFVIAKSAGTRIPQERKCELRQMAVLPLNFDAGPRLQVHFHGFRVG